MKLKDALEPTDNISSIVTKALLNAKEDNRTPWQRSHAVIKKLATKEFLDET